MESVSAAGKLPSDFVIVFAFEMLKMERQPYCPTPQIDRRNEPTLSLLSVFCLRKYLHDSHLSLRQLGITPGHEESL